MSKRHSSIRKVTCDENTNRGPDSMFVVDLYENNKLIETRELPGKSSHYAYDVSERWDSGIINMEKSN